MKYLLIIISCCFMLQLYGKKKEAFYPFTDVPEELKVNANSVTRLESLKLNIISENKAVYSVRSIITVLNENGDDDAILYISYDSNRKPSIIEANFYDGAGELIEKVKKADIYDQCSYDGFSLFSDARFKRITPHISNYPFTVEYEYSLELDGVVDYPDWMALGAYNRSVQYAEYEIVAENGMDIRFKEHEISAAIKGEETEAGKVYKWEIKNLPAMEREPYALPLDKLVSGVKVSPVSFEYDGYAGKMDSWENFGKWTYSLLEGRSEIPEERKAFLRDLVKDEEDKFKQVELIYKFLQKKVRYVSIQLGIGGWQPFSAEIVDEVGYGDCKALSNYMKAMLEVVGIKSFYTRIRAGKNVSGMDPQFPSNFSNHIILTVPLENDTIFLECTNSFAPCGYLGRFTSDRYALLVSEEGGKLIRTPKYEGDVNSRISKTEIILDENGNAEMKEEVTFKALQYDFIDSELRKTKDKQIESEYKNSDLSGVKILDVKYAAVDEIIPSAKRTRDIEVAKYASTMGDRMFIPINKLNNISRPPKKKEDRKYPFQLTFAYSDSDTVVYKLPLGYSPEFIPKPISIETEFGKFSFDIEVEDDAIIYSRSHKMHEGIFPADKYMGYVDFMKEVVKADNQKVILKKLN